MAVFQVITDCNRFIEDSDPIKPGTYLARIGIAWLVAMLFTYHLATENEIVLQAMLLMLLLVSSRTGRHPVGRGNRLALSCFWIMAGGIAWICSLGFAELTSEAHVPLPEWQAYFYVLATCAAWMVAFFLKMTTLLCRRYITGKNSWRDIDKAIQENQQLKNMLLTSKLARKLVETLKRKPLLLILMAAVLAMAIEFLLDNLRYYVAYYVTYYGMHEGKIQLAIFFVIAALSILANYIALSRHRNYLKATGKIA